MNPYMIGRNLTIDRDRVMALWVEEPILMEVHAWRVKAMLSNEGARPETMVVGWFGTGVANEHADAEEQARSLKASIEYALRHPGVTGVSLPNEVNA